jgi:hypothetical protein
MTVVLRSRLRPVAISMLPEAVPPRDHRTPHGGTPRGEDSVPRITPLQAAKQRLQWSKTLHERLGVDCYYCEDYYVVANVGRLVCAVETKDQRRVRLLRESYEAGALPGTVTHVDIINRAAPHHVRII